MLRVQEYQEIETRVTLGNDDFGWQFGKQMSHKCHIFQAVWK